MMKEILELLESNAKLTVKDIAIMLSKEEAEIEAKIKEMEDKKIIIGYHTLVNWEKVGEEKVSAVIEVRMTPQRDVGFDAVAERISRFPEVRSVRLVSGTYDLSVTIEGTSMREVNHFVATKLATIEGVVSTTTHFIMKTYKQDGVIMEEEVEDRRLVVSP